MFHGETNMCNKDLYGKIRRGSSYSYPSLPTAPPPSLHYKSIIIGTRNNGSSYSYPSLFMCKREKSN